MFSLATRLFGQDPKLEFRKPGAGVSLLAGLPIAPDDPYWTQYWQLFDSPTDVITLLDSVSLTLTLNRRPENFFTLVHVLSSHLFALLALPDFPSSPPPRDLAREALNCVRVLSRVVPFLNGAPGKGKDDLEKAVFWRKEKVRVYSDKGKSGGRMPEAEIGGEGQFVIEDDSDDEDEQPEPTKEKEDEEEWEELPALASRLMAALVDLMFVPGFTVAEECRSPNGGSVSHVIWEPGIAAQPSELPPTSPSILSARLEILRLLNLLLSLPSLLTPSSLFPTQSNPWRDLFVSSLTLPKPTLERKVVLCLLCSVFNTAFAASAPSGSLSPTVGGFALGSAIGGAAEKIGGVVLRREDVKGLLIGTCLQFLGILFVEHATAPPPTSITSPEPRTGPTSVVASPFLESAPTLTAGGSTPPSSTAANLENLNTFSFYLAKLHRGSDFDLLLNGIISILSQSAGSQSIIPVPGVAPSKGWATEALIVLWRMCELNPKLLKRMVETGKVGVIVTLLMSFCLDYKDDETQLGLVRMSAFMLQTFTAEHGWETQLNGPVDAKLGSRAKQNAGASVADFLIISIYNLIFTTKARLAALYPPFVLTIANISPFLKNLSIVSSTRLLQLFLAFSAPSFLLMEEGNPRLVFYMLETFNNVIHYQLSANPNLIYSIVRSHKRFEELSHFTLAGGVAEVRRVRQEKRLAAAEKAATSTSSTPRSPVAVPMKEMTSRRESSNSEKVEEHDDEDDGEEGSAGPVSDKAKGKRKERSLSVSTLAPSELAIETAHEEEVFVGKNGFVPTEGWVSSWREGLPLDGILILLSEFRPHLINLSNSIDSDDEALDYLRTASLAGLLPPLPPIRSRRFLFTPPSLTWLASVLYGSVYLNALDLLRDVPVQLFAVAQARRANSAQELISGAAAFVRSKTSGK